MRSFDSFRRLGDVFVRTLLWLIGLSATEIRAQPVELYGILNLMAKWDSGLLPDAGETQEKENLWDLDPRSSRAGLRLKPSDLQGWTVNGQLEVDFKGSGRAQALRLRHVYFTLQQAGGPFELLAGQTNEVIAPFRPDSINFPAENWPGDIGSRRAQLRVTYAKPLGDKRWIAQASANAIPLTLENPSTHQTKQVNVPVVQGRLAVNLPAFGGEMEWGLWGHTGRKKHAAQDNMPEGRLRTRSLGMDIRCPFGKQWTLTGEYWVGEMGDAYPQNDMASFTFGEAIRSIGGWASLAFTPNPRWRFNAGYGAHDPENLSLYPGQADRMSSWFLNGYWTLYSRLEVGLEASQWQSTFRGTTGSNDDLRVQLSLSYSF